MERTVAFIGSADVYLERMGIQRWVRRDTADRRAIEAGNSSRETPAIEPQWTTLRTRALQCTACDLHKSRTQVVFGVGPVQADWMIIGEAPGAEEDRRGEPFVGRAGQLLNEMLRAVGLRREQVYIANVLKCRPPRNRDPSPEEVACCEPFLREQVRLLRPKIILAVGRIAAQNLLKTDLRVGALRGRRFHYGEEAIPLVVTYHPAYLLRSPTEKRKAWEDLQLAARLGGAGGQFNHGGPRPI